MTSDCKSRFLINFYPRPPRGGRRINLMQHGGTKSISIPALREEGDVDGNVTVTKLAEFLSPPSARRATRPRLDSSRHMADFYPRPPRGGRRIPFD